MMDVTGSHALDHICFIKDLNILVIFILIKVFKFDKIVIAPAVFTNNRNRKSEYC